MGRRTWMPTTSRMILTARGRVVMKILFRAEKLPARKRTGFV